MDRAGAALSSDQGRISSPPPAADIFRANSNAPASTSTSFDFKAYADPLVHDIAIDDIRALKLSQGSPG